jgi:short-subunit dehydrogenase
MTAAIKPLAVMTGGSSGIGYHLPAKFVEADYDVLICAEDARVTEGARTLSRPLAPVRAVRADLATFAGVEELIAVIKSTQGLVDALALNAAVGNAGPFVGTPLEADLNVVALNVTSTVHLAKALLPDMVAKGAGRVLFTASIAGNQPGPYYAASKAFVLSFAEALRHETKDSGVTITALMPGPTDTEFFDRAGMADTAAGQGPKSDPAKVAEQGFAALMEGKDHVVAGARVNKLQAVAAAVLPDEVNAALHAKMTTPHGKS